MTHSFKLAAMALCSVALSGGAFADVALKAEFRFDRSLSAEDNYAAFEKVASQACAVPTRPGVAAHKRIKACESQMLADAIAATGVQSLIALHNVHNGVSEVVQIAKLP